jgi:hypothetical protein
LNSVVVVQFAVGARETREGGQRMNALAEAGEDRGAVAVAVLLLSRSNIPFVPDRVVVLSRFAVLVLSRSAVLVLSRSAVLVLSRSVVLLLSRSLPTRPPTYKEKTAE